MRFLNFRGILLRATIKEEITSAQSLNENRNQAVHRGTLLDDKSESSVEYEGEGACVKFTFNISKKVIT